MTTWFTVDYIAQDLIKLNLGFSARVDATYLNPANYQITPYNISPIAAISVAVEEVIAVNNYGKNVIASPVNAAVAASVVFLRTTRHAPGANYEVTFTELHTTNGSIITQDTAVPYQARITKVDSILKSAPAHFDRRTSSIIRNILSAIGVQDDQIGGSKKEEFPPPIAPSINTITSISNFIYLDAYYATVIGEGPQGGDKFTFWFIGWDLRPTGMLQIPFSGMSDLAALQGWVFCIDAAGAVYFRIGPDAFNPVIDTPSYSLSAANENALTVFHGVIDVSAGEVTLYCNGVPVGGTSISGYAPTNSPITVGGFSNGAQFPLAQGGFCGGGAVDAVMTASEILEHYNDMVLNGSSTVPVAVDATSWNYNTADANAVWPSTGSYSDALILNGAGLVYTEQPLVWSP